MAATAVTKNTKRSGKENAPPSRSGKVVGGSINLDEEFEDEGDSFGGFAVDDDAKPMKTAAKVPPARTLKSSRSRPSEDHEDEGVSGAAGVGQEDAQRKLKAMISERDRLRTQRDTFAKQFEELSKLRKSDSEALFEKLKEKTALQAKAQNDIIASQAAVIEKLQSKVQMLEKSLKEAVALPSAGGVFEALTKAEPKDVKALKEDVAKLRTQLKEKDDQCTSLQREYKAEVDHSRSLQASTRTAPSSVISAISNTPEDAEKDAVSLRLYEDLTDLQITNVRIKPGKGGKEITYNCIQTIGERSLNFKLRSFTELDPALHASKADNPWMKRFHYMPEGLEYEQDKKFVSRLEVFGSEFTVPRDQAGPLWKELRRKMGEKEDVAEVEEA